jgi:hypothetical protein
MLCMTYLREQDIWAWTQQPIAGAGGSTRGLTVVPVDGEDTPYVIAVRTGQSRSIEKLMPRKAGTDEYDSRLSPAHMDGLAVYDGTNLIEPTPGAVSFDDTVSMALTSGVGWLMNSIVTLTASAAAFPNDGSNMGNGYRLKVGADEVEVVVTTETSTTTCAVKLLQDCPTALQTGSTTDWVRMVRSVSGADHLEGFQATVYADGATLSLDDGGLVASGVVDVSVSNGGRAGGYGIIQVGLIPDFDVELMDIDNVQERDPLPGRTKRVAYAQLGVWNTRGLSVGLDSARLAPWNETPEHTASYDTSTPYVKPLQTGHRDYHFKTEFNYHGRILVRQEEPLPATLSWVVREAEVGKRGRT